MFRPHWIFAFVTCCVFAAAASSRDDAPVQPPISCGNGLVGGVNCRPTKQELKEAKQAFERGIKLHQSNHLEEAMEQFDDAARLVPQSLQFLAARETVKAQLVFSHVHRGDGLLLAHNRDGAAAEFKAALALDPDDSYAHARLDVATGATESYRQAVERRLEDAGEIHVKPSDDLATFHFLGDIRDLFQQLAAAYRVQVVFDESIEARQVMFNVDQVDFFTALKLACKVSKMMWVPLSEQQFMIAKDTDVNHKQFDRMAMRTFILPPHTTPQEATDVMTTLRNMFDLRFIQIGQSANTLEVRGPYAALQACATLMEQLDVQRPQVMLDVQVFQISHQLTRNIGLHAPQTFNLYNIPAIALAGLGGQSISQLINQLISSGGINQAGSSSLSGLLAQLTGGQNSIFSNPLATFGGGLTFMGLSLDQLAAQLSVNESWVRSLDNVSMLTSQRNEATFHLGERYPVINASFAPIYNSSQISAVLGNQTYVPPVPSVSYEDLGLQIKAKPTIQADNSVSLDIDMQVRSLTGESNNGVPVISNRQYKGSIRLADGEPAFLAGEISQSDTLSMSGLPGFGAIPGMNFITATNTKTEEDDELMIAITPHVVSNFTRDVPAIQISER